MSADESGKLPEKVSVIRPSEHIAHPAASVAGVRAVTAEPEGEAISGTDRAPSAELVAHFEENSEQLAEFLACKSRLQDRMAGTRREMHKMRATVADEQRQFDAVLQHLRAQVAHIIEPSRTTAPSRVIADGVDIAGSHAPPSTPAEVELN